MVILLWVYYASLIMFIGAEFTKVYARRERHRYSAERIRGANQ